MSPRPISDEDLALVRRVAERMVLELGGHCTAGEVLGAGYVGLLRAKDGFQESKGASWQTYAWKRIKGEILDTARIMDHTRRANKPEFVSLEQHERRGGRESGGDGRARRHPQEISDPDVVNAEQNLEDRDYIRWLKIGLTDLEERVVTAYFERGITQVDIGLILGKSNARVCQIVKQAIKVMRSRVRATGGAA